MHSTHRSSERGFTLLELMLALAVLSILMGIGVPAFNDTIRNNQISATGAAEVPKAALQLQLAKEQIEKAKVLMKDGENELAHYMALRAGNNSAARTVPSTLSRSSSHTTNSVWLCEARNSRSSSFEMSTSTHSMSMRGVMIAATR